MRIIDADKLKEIIKGNDYNVVACHNLMDRGMFTIGIMQAIDEAPTIDAKPVIHGHWKMWDEDYGDTFECSECGEVFYLVDGTPEENNYKYCPACGALLDGEVEQ